MGVSPACTRPAIRRPWPRRPPGRAHRAQRRTRRHRGRAAARLPLLPGPARQQRGSAPGERRARLPRQRSLVVAGPADGPRYQAWAAGPCSGRRRDAGRRAGGPGLTARSPTCSGPTRRTSPAASLGDMPRYVKVRGALVRLRAWRDLELRVVYSGTCSGARAPARVGSCSRSPPRASACRRPTTPSSDRTAMRNRRPGRAPGLRRTLQVAARLD